MLESLWITIFLSAVVFSNSTVMRLSINSPKEKKTSNKNVEQKLVSNIPLSSPSVLMTSLSPNTSIKSTPPTSRSLSSNLPELSKISSLSSYEERRRKFLTFSPDLDDEQMEKMLVETRLDLTFRKEMFVWIQEIKLRKSREEKGRKKEEEETGESSNSSSLQIGDYLNERRFSDVFFDNNNTGDASLEEDHSATLPKISIFSIICDSSSDGNCSTESDEGFEASTESYEAFEASTESEDIHESFLQFDDLYEEHDDDVHEEHDDDAYEDHDDFPPANMVPDPEKSIEYVDSQEPQEEDHPVVLEKRPTLKDQNTTSNEMSFLQGKFMNFHLTPPKIPKSQDNALEKERASNIVLVLVFGGLFLFLLILSIVFLVTRTVGLDIDEVPELEQLNASDQESEESCRTELKEWGGSICCGFTRDKNRNDIKDSLYEAWRVCTRPCTNDYIDLY